MRGFLATAFVGSMLLAACVPAFTRLGGSGVIVTEERATGEFSTVEISSSIQANLEQGDREGVRVEAEDNVIDKVETSVSAGKLTIRIKPDLTLLNTEPVRVTVWLKDLQGLEVNSSARVTAGAIQAGTLTLRTDSSGRLEIAELTAGHLDATVMASSRVTLAGAAQSLALSSDSAARFDAGDLQVGEARVNATASSQVTVWVTRALEANASRSANVSYYGAPAQVTKNESSSGSVEALGDK